MDSAKNFLDLPNEIIEVILQDRDITHIDLCRISQTCTDMQNLCMSNELWRRKLHQRYSVLQILLFWVTECHCRLCVIKCDTHF